MANRRESDDSTRPRAESSRQGERSNSNASARHEARASLNRPSTTYILECDPSDSDVVPPQTESGFQDEDRSGEGWGKHKPRTFSNLTRKLNKQGRLDADTSGKKVFQVFFTTKTFFLSNQFRRTKRTRKVFKKNFD